MTTIDITTPATTPATKPAVDFSATEITGIVRSMRAYDSDDDGTFSILSLDVGTAVGVVSDDEQPLRVGCAYRFFGQWTVHDTHGEQFKFVGYALSERQTQMGVIAFLTRSDLGLTRSDAASIWKSFGSDSIAMVRECPSDVVTQIEADKEQYDRIYAASVELQETQHEQVRIELFELFAGRGFPKATVRACVANWGAVAAARIRRNPFIMLVRNVPGVGWKRADKLYLDMGGNPSRLKRQMLAAWNGIRASNSGNTWESESVLLRAVLQDIGTIKDAPRAIEMGIRAGWISRRHDGDWHSAFWGGASASANPLGVFYAERTAANAEMRLAAHIKRILGKHRAIWPAVTAEDHEDEHQRAKLAEIASSPMAILAGTPGTGKTTSAAVLIRLLMHRLHIPPGKIAVCAPTGKAAVRITEAMRRHDLPLTATTIHQLLEINGNTHSGEFKFRRNESNPLDKEVVIVDEGSMCDTPLAAALVSAIPADSNLLVIGDPYQLPPVGHGAPLRDMIAGGVPTAMLTEIKRNAGAIVRACAKIKDGGRFDTVRRPDEATGDNLVHIDAEDEDAQLQTIVSLLGTMSSVGIDPIWDCQVLVTTNDKSKVSRKNVNSVLQEFLNPRRSEKPADGFNPKYRDGDKVICLRNDLVSIWETADGDRGDRGDRGGQDGSDAKPAATPAGFVMDDFRKTPRTAYVANGDIGCVLATNPKAAVVRFTMPSRVVRVATERKQKGDDAGTGDSTGGTGKADAGKAEFDLAYGITIHKSQGSEWPVVIIILDENAGRLGCRELIYTAISRASRLCFLVGKLPTAFKWAWRANLTKRKTFLAEMLQTVTADDVSKGLSGDAKL